MRCLGDDDCCSPSHKCGLGDGDCDDSADCVDGLVCGECTITQGYQFDSGDECCVYSEGIDRALLYSNLI